MTQTVSPNKNQPLNKLRNFFDTETILYIVKRVLQGLLFKLHQEII